MSGLACPSDVSDFCGDWWFEHREDFSQLPAKPANRKCDSCGKHLCAGDDVLQLDIYRYPNDEELAADADMDEDDAVLSDMVFYCDECGGILLSLEAAGFSVILDDSHSDVHEALQQYWEMTGFDPNKYREKAK